MTATQTSKRGGRMAAHVHPETYQASDPLDYRAPQLHTTRAQCELTACTFRDLLPEAAKRYIEEAKALRAQIAEAQAAAAPTPRKARKGRDAELTLVPGVGTVLPATPARKAASKRAHPSSQPTPAGVGEEPTPKPARKAVPNAERRTEATHPDGGSAVSHGKCPQCGSRKGVVCTSKLGAPTNAVHAPRMRAWEAAGSPSLPMPAPARKRGGVWVVAK